MQPLTCSGANIVSMRGSFFLPAEKSHILPIINYMRAQPSLNSIT